MGEDGARSRERVHLLDGKGQAQLVKEGSFPPPSACLGGTCCGQSHSSFIVAMRSHTDGLETATQKGGVTAQALGAPTFMLCDKNKLPFV